MDKLGRMQIMDAFENLVEDEYLMHFLENIGAYNRMQVGFHELKNQVQILLVLRLHHPEQLYHIVILQAVKDLNLPVCALGIDGIPKCIEYFLQGVDFVCFFLPRLPYVPVGSASHLSKQLVVF